MRAPAARGVAEVRQLLRTDYPHSHGPHFSGTLHPQPRILRRYVAYKYAPLTAAAPAVHLSLHARAHLPVPNPNPSSQVDLPRLSCPRSAAGIAQAVLGAAQRADAKLLVVASHGPGEGREGKGVEGDEAAGREAVVVHEHLCTWLKLILCQSALGHGPV